MPKRIQMTRARPWRQDHPDAVIVARPGPFGNPWIVGQHGKLDTATARLILPRSLTAEDAAEQFDAWMYGYAIPKGMRPENLTSAGRRAIWDELALRRKRIWDRMPDLRGKDLACWCPLDKPCHADVLLRLANA